MLAGSGSPVRLRNQSAIGRPISSAMWYGATPALLLASWQPVTQFAVRIGWTWVFQPTPTMSVAAVGLVLIRAARGLSANSSGEPVANVSSRPGGTTVVAV